MIANVYGCANPSPAVQDAMRKAWPSTVKPEHRRPDYAARQMQAANKRKNERPLTEHERDLAPMLRLLADAGKTAEDAGKVVGCGKSTAFRVARLSGFCFSAKKAAAIARAEAARPAIEQGIAEGLSLTQVAEKLGTWPSTIRKFCDRLGIDFPSPQKRIPAIKADIKAAVEGGMNYNQAAQKFGVSRETVRRAFRGELG